MTVVRIINSVPFLVLFVLVRGQEFRASVSFINEGKSHESNNQYGHIQVVQPLTCGATLHAEVQRLQSLKDVFPDPNESYFVPYGDRSVVSLQFPTFSNADVNILRNNGGNGYGPPVGYGPPPLGPSPSYGPHLPPPVYGPFNKGDHHQHRLRKPQDYGVITSQNYVYRRNVRDYGGFAKIFENIPSSQDLLINVGKMLGSEGGLKGSSSGFSSNLVNMLNLKRLSNIFGPTTKDSFKDRKNKSKLAQSFALLVIESRVKVAEREPRELSLTNGSIIFPSSSNPNVLTFVPFILRRPGDAENVFCGYEHDMDGRERREFIALLKMAEGIHEDAHLDGKRRLRKVKELSDSLKRPRVPKSQLILEDENGPEEKLARESLSLYTATIALRTLSSPSEEEENGRGPVGPVGGSYGRENQFPASDYGVGIDYGVGAPSTFQYGGHSYSKNPEVTNPISSSNTSFIYKTIL